MTSIKFSKIEKLLKKLGREEKKKRGPHKKYIIDIEGVPNFFVPLSRGSKGDEAGEELIKDLYKKLKIDKSFFLKLINGYKKPQDYKKYIRKKHKEGKL